MINMVRLIITVSIIVLVCSSLYAADIDSLFNSGFEKYNNAQYEEALEDFLSLKKNGID